VCDIEDLDDHPERRTEELARRWISSFQGTAKAVEVVHVHRCFQGNAIVRVRATVAHDSYERLVEVCCSPDAHHTELDRSGLNPIPHTIENPSVLGVRLDKLAEAAQDDSAIAEFSRFYMERRAQETAAAGDDLRRRRKLNDDFTPRLEMALVALEGVCHRQVVVNAQYNVDAEFDYHSTLTVTPHTGELVDAPSLSVCARSGRSVPKTCLKQCQISKVTVLQHLLVPSEISSRLALPEHTVVCSLSNKRVLQDEAEVSAVSGRLVASSLLKSSAVSGKRGEPQYFGQCAFTGTEVLNAELTTSEISGRRYRIDEQVRSAVSGRAGHKREFIICHETGKQLAMAEAEQCEATGKYVVAGILEACAITGKRVLPSELLCCAATGKRALRSLLGTSSVTGAHILKEVAVRSVTGKLCAPVEAQRCFWSGRKIHPEDLRVCELTGLPIHFEYATGGVNARLQPLVDVLNAIKKTADAADLWEVVVTAVILALGKGRCHVEASVISPDERHLAVCVEFRTLFGLRVRHAGLVYSIGERNIVGRVALGRRTTRGWVDARHG